MSRKGHNNVMKPYLKRAWAEISLENLSNNINEIKKILGDRKTEIMAVVKADAYGHGEDQVCRCLWDNGVRYFAVSNLDEAIAVRKSCSEAEILILGYTPPEYAQTLADENIIQGIVSSEYTAELSKFTSKPVRCHVKIDTGMGRIGLKFDSPEQCAAEVAVIAKNPKLCVEGIYTHFAVADCDDAESVSYTDKQEKFILDTYDILCKNGLKLRHVHFMNSAATYSRTNGRSTLARAGIIMYGLHPNYPMPIPDGFKPVMALKAVISHVKTVPSGSSISYGRTFTAESEMRIATVTIGYADGYSRQLSSKGEILVHGQRCRIVGRVCMDQLMIDVTNVDAKPGDIVTLIGKDGDDEITADELASIYGTIGYEVVCGISKRVPRIFEA
ncbi:MAG: alanine racemase [Ruminococcus sp.]|nr:alanine racemase [Ruminococcus sp.]